jgi:hypothetical protein
MGIDWRRLLRERLASYGHRNWIVVADSAYPAQSSTGIETVATACGQTEALSAVLEEIAAAGHVRAAIYTDRELTAVPETDAPGVQAYRDRLRELLSSRQVRELPHEQIIAMLDEAGRSFRILILKTTMKIPYTSVFLQLECGYWSEEAERRLRAGLM